MDRDGHSSDSPRTLSAGGTTTQTRSTSDHFLLPQASIGQTVADVLSLKQSAQISDAPVAAAEPVTMAAAAEVTAKAAVPMFVNCKSHKLTLHILAADGGTDAIDNKPSISFQRSSFTSAAAINHGTARGTVSPPSAAPTLTKDCGDGSVPRCDVGPGWGSVGSVAVSRLGMRLSGLESELEAVRVEREVMAVELEQCRKVRSGGGAGAREGVT